jgi:hypothetical protein
MQFTAYNNLFNIFKDANKLLPSVAGCVMEVLSEIKVLCKEELALMAMLCLLPCDQYAREQTKHNHQCKLLIKIVDGEGTRLKCLDDAESLHDMARDLLGLHFMQQ